MHVARIVHYMLMRPFAPVHCVRTGYVSAPASYTSRGRRISAVIGRLPTQRTAFSSSRMDAVLATTSATETVRIPYDVTDGNFELRIH
jgi:hypothetical protein